MLSVGWHRRHHWWCGGLRHAWLRRPTSAPPAFTSDLGHGRLCSGTIPQDGDARLLLIVAEPPLPMQT